MRLQPIALDKSSGVQPGGRGLAKLLEELGKGAGKQEAGIPAIQGLANEDALRKVMQARKPCSASSYSACTSVAQGSYVGLTP